MITKERASRLEGSFGKEEGTLSFKKDKSQNKENRNTLDILWNTHCKLLRNWQKNTPTNFKKSSLNFLIEN